MPTSSTVQSQLDDLSKEMKETVVSIATLVKAITPDNTVAQSDPSGIADPKTVYKADADLIRVTDSEIEKEVWTMTMTVCLTIWFKNWQVPSLIWSLG